jgi:electron transport complex protein RnfE
MPDEFMKGIWRENPVFVQALGMCPTLAVTNSARNAIAMGLATTFVLLASGLVISMMRNVIPKQVRIATFVLIIATFVTSVDYAIEALDLALHAALGAFISLIVVNCLILGRIEAFASKNGVVATLFDGLGMGAGFTVALLCLGSIRELLGEGTLFGLALLPAQFEPWVVMLLPSGGFFALAIWVLAVNKLRAGRLRAAALTMTEEVA